MTTRTNWGPVLNRAREIANGYQHDVENGVTFVLVTLRHLFYDLITEGLIENTKSAYKTLSSKTAELRRRGVFPELIDRTRVIHKIPSTLSPRHALILATLRYTVDRTAGQPVSIYLGCEKEGTVALLDEWFSNLGITIIALSGFSSRGYQKAIMAHIQEEVRKTGRDAILIYVGDFDASGTYINVIFEEHTEDRFTGGVYRIGLNADQIDNYRAARTHGKHTDSRTNWFVEKFGDAALWDPKRQKKKVGKKPTKSEAAAFLDAGKPVPKLIPVEVWDTVQIEMEAIPLAELRNMFIRAIREYGEWDDEAFAECIQREKDGKAALHDVWQYMPDPDHVWDVDSDWDIDEQYENYGDLLKELDELPSYEPVEDDDVEDLDDVDVEDDDDDE